MAQKLDFHCSHHFEGTIWNILADTAHNRLFLEIRDTTQKKVSFSAFELISNTFLWKGLLLEEPWWVNLVAVVGDTMLFNHYTETNNPDRKSVIALGVNNQKIIWWKNDFSISAVSDRYVVGQVSKLDFKTLTLDVSTGEPTQLNAPESFGEQNFQPIRPFQYQQGSDHFETVRSFLELTCKISPAVAVEYLEHDDIIIISAYVANDKLANYLFVFTRQGDKLMQEKLDEHLKGIGLNTFFILSGYLIFVKNKCELVSYKLV